MSVAGSNDALARQEDESHLNSPTSIKITWNLILFVCVAK